MKIAAGHESKHKAAMSNCKAGDVAVVIPISTTPCVPERGASVSLHFLLSSMLVNLN